jgi:hypothetical protein
MVTAGEADTVKQLQDLGTLTEPANPSAAATTIREADVSPRPLSS